jgi:hypothetical protein
MEKAEQRFIVKFFFLKSLGSKKIRREFIAVLGSTAYSLTQIKEWGARFKAGGLSCEDKFRPAHPLHVLAKSLSDFFEEFLFITAGIIVQHFNQSKPTIKKILQRELWL